MNAVAETVAETEAKKPAKTREVEVVELSDGRKVEFVGKRRMLKDTKVTEDSAGVVFDFKNGRTIEFTVPTSLLYHFAAHGAAQKIGDETAGEEDVDDMVLSVEDIIGRLNEGKWSKDREGGGFGGTSILIQALQLAWPTKTLDQIRGFLKDKTKVQKDAMRASSQLKPIVDKLEAEKAAKSAHVNTDELFASLDAVPDATA